MSNGQNFPQVTFIIPVLNAANLLENCLASILRQTYPRDDYEILIVDGGSHDGSQDIARKHGAIVIDDQVSRHMEESKKVGVARARGEYIVFVDADNEITHPDYLERAVQALAQHPDTLGVEAYYLPSPKMSSLCAYLTHLLHISDPVCWLMSVDPVFLRAEGEVEWWTLPPGTFSYPLGANGFVYRRKDLESVQADQRFQDTHIALFLMQQGKRQWLRLRGRGVHHYYVQTLWGFLQKRRRAMVHFMNVRSEMPTMWMDQNPPIPGWLACLYCVTLAGPLYHATRGWLKTGDARWFWHVPASLLSFLGILWGWQTHRKRAREKRLIANLQPRQTLKAPPA